MNQKIESKHLDGLACVYVRQSSVSQVRTNVESRRRQIKLTGTAGELGWPEQRIRVIDEDQGKSGTNSADRPGYQELLGLVVAGQVGIVLAVDVSRLARDDMAWQLMVRHCLFAGVLMADEAHVYDPRDDHDRMMLGMLGTLAEYELGVLRKRMQQSYQQKARRGALYGACPAGYMVQGEQLVETPDARVRHVLKTLFAQFGRLPSAGALSRWCFEHDVEVPVSLDARGGQVAWRAPTVARLLRILHSPSYAGAYAFGHRPTIKELGPDGQVRRRRTKVPISECSVLIKDHHAAYIDWDQFERNQSKLEANRPERMIEGRKGSGRGTAMLSGLLACGTCGCGFSVHYSSATRFRYVCRQGGKQSDGHRVTCQSVPGPELDQLVADALLEVVSPLGVEAAIEAESVLLEERRDQRRLLEDRLEQTRYETRRARRQYDNVDPDNRLVASELESRWNAALQAQAKAEQCLGSFDHDVPGQLSEEQRKGLLVLGEDLHRLWFSTDTAVETKKQIVKLVCRRITVGPADSQECHSVRIHWFGDCLTEHRLQGRVRKPTAKPTVDLATTVSTLRRILDDDAVAQALNRARISTNDGGTWTRERVHAFGRRHGIKPFDAERKRREGDLTAEEAAGELRISSMSVHRLIRSHILAAAQTVPGLPCVVRLADVHSVVVEQAAARIREGSSANAAAADDPRQMTLWTEANDEPTDV